MGYIFVSGFGIAFYIRITYIGNSLFRTEKAKASTSPFSPFFNNSESIME